MQKVVDMRKRALCTDEIMSWKWTFALCSCHSHFYSRFSTQKPDEIGLSLDAYAKAKNAARARACHLNSISLIKWRCVANKIATATKPRRPEHLCGRVNVCAILPTKTKFEFCRSASHGRNPIANAYQMDFIRASMCKFTRINSKGFNFYFWAK